MFINTAADFPEGAILKVSFRLAKSNHHIVVRCEVRYCLSGVGIGVEFMDMSPVDQRAIAKETGTPTLSFKVRGAAAAKKRRITTTKTSATRGKKQTVRPKKR
jgi:hypothetical protein